MNNSLANALLAANFLLEYPNNEKRKLNRICMINNNNKIIKKFKSAELAAEKLNVSSVDIRMAITNGHTLGGFIWRWN